MALRILLADDSMIAQNMGRKILSEAGYDVHTVSNGAAALKKLPDLKPDILLLDVYMPGYSGLEVCAQVKEGPRTALVPVLLTVGKMEPFRVEDGMRAKADGVIIKPFEATDLVAVVGKLAERIRMRPPAPAPEPADRLMERQSVFASTEDKPEAPAEVAASPATDLEPAASEPAFAVEDIDTPAAVPDFEVSMAAPAIELETAASPAPTRESEIATGLPAFDVQFENNPDTHHETGPVIAIPNTSGAEIELESLPDNTAVEFAPEAVVIEPSPVLERDDPAAPPLATPPEQSAEDAPVLLLVPDEVTGKMASDPMLPVALERDDAGTEFSGPLPELLAAGGSTDQGDQHAEMPQAFADTDLPVATMVESASVDDPAPLDQTSLNDDAIAKVLAAIAQDAAQETVQAAQPPDIEPMPPVSIGDPEPELAPVTVEPEIEVAPPTAEPPTLETVEPGAAAESTEFPAVPLPESSETVPPAQSALAAAAPEVPAQADDHEELATSIVDRVFQRLRPELIAELKRQMARR